MSSLDGHMSMSDHYEFRVDGSIKAIKSTDKPFSADEIKNCPTCRGSLRNIARYGRIVRRALLDEATKKFIVWSNAQYTILAERLFQEQGQLKHSIDGMPNLSPFTSDRSISLDDPGKTHIAALSEFPGYYMRYSSITALRDDITTYIGKVNKEEQPFERVARLVKLARRHPGSDADPGFATNVPQMRGTILATALILHCDLTILSDFVSLGNRAMRDGSFAGKFSVDFLQNRNDCKRLISLAQESSFLVQEVEGHIYFAKFAGLERTLSEPQRQLSLLNEAISHLNTARLICREKQSMTHFLKEIDALLKDLRSNMAFYSIVTPAEMQAVVRAMRNEFLGTGHWYYCQNNHPFTIGECGMPMQLATCPQCGAQVGGTGHNLAAGVRAASDIEAEFGRLTV
jgi:hypothetical protein